MGGKVKETMMKLSAAGQAIQKAFGTKDMDTIKAMATQIAECAKMAMGMEGMQKDQADMYKMMGDGAAELSAAADKKSEADMLAAMKKVAGSCTDCHAKYKK